MVVKLLPVGVLVTGVRLASLPAMDVESRDLALHAARKMYDKGAEQLTVLRITEEYCLYDYVVIGNGRSERQANTLVDEVYHFCKRHGIAHSPVEGDAGWFLIDCFSVVVHSFTEELRDYYQLDHLWTKAERVDHEAAWAKLPDPDKDR
jgi:ribosome-associated protein